MEAVIHLALRTDVQAVTVKMTAGADGTIVLPNALPSDPAERTRRPEDLADAAAIACGLVAGRIAEHAREPWKGRDAIGPIHALALTPGAPPKVVNVGPVPV